MPQLHLVGATARGRSKPPPERDDAEILAADLGIREQTAEQTQHRSAGMQRAQRAPTTTTTTTSSLAAAAAARGAGVGIKVFALGDDEWLMRSAGGAAIGVARGADVLSDAVAGFEAARRDVRALLQAMQGKGSA